MASIQAIQGPDKGLVFDLTDGENILGRQSQTVPLQDGTISRHHARLTTKDGTWTLEDLGSANGTFLNGVKLGKPSQVKLGDQIRIGATLLVFTTGKAAPQAAVDVDEDGQLVDAAIVATVPSNEDSVIIPTPEAGAEAIGNLRILYDLISEVSSVFNVDLLLQRTMGKVFEVVKADRGYIMLIDAAGKLDPKVSKLSEQYGEQQIPISRTIINEVVSKQVGVLSSNAMSDKRFASGKSVHDFGIRSALCVPIKGRERILGVIHVDCSVSEHTYSTEQLRLLTAIGYQTGLAIENVRLYEAAVQGERLAAVGETVASLSHHIKNILQALGAGIDVVELGLKRDNLTKAKDAWPIVQRNLGKINDLILNMLAFSKSREPLLEKTNINHVLNECVELINPRADERGVAVMSDLDDLPAIPADPAGLQQAFMNLLTNALEAVSDGTGVTTVFSKYDSMNRDVVVKIMDNGSGIGAEELGRIFNPFWSSKGQKGTGLGLAVAKKVFEEHRGRIEVASKVGEGTTFTVTLPAMSGKAADSNDTDAPGK
ncbi:MAG: FHA domain-containing protein [Phycisphaerae bacterium]|nr:FHA domain-containing protein [Phycisphaerae bacterium]